MACPYAYCYNAYRTTQTGHTPHTPEMGIDFLSSLVPYWQHEAVSFRYLICASYWQRPQDGHLLDQKWAHSISPAHRQGLPNPPLRSRKGQNLRCVPPRSRMARVISFSIYKGGTGKTTSTVNTAAALAHKGKRVLLVDVDQQ